VNPLREFRDKHHLTVRRVANELGVTERTVIAWETGSFKPSNVRMSSIAHIMGIDFHFLEAEWQFWQSMLKHENSKS